MRIASLLIAVAAVSGLCFSYSPVAHAYDPFRQGDTVCPPVKGAAPTNSTASHGVGAGNSTVCAPTTTSNPLLGPTGLFTKVTTILAIIAGAAAVIVIIIAGLQYITAGGDSKNVSNAKNTILYALIGLVVIVVAQTIISFVLSKL